MLVFIPEVIFLSFDILVLSFAILFLYMRLYS